MENVSIKEGIQIAELAVQLLEAKADAVILAGRLQLESDCASWVMKNHSVIKKKGWPVTCSAELAEKMDAMWKGVSGIIDAANVAFQDKARTIPDSDKFVLSLYSMKLFEFLKFCTKFEVLRLKFNNHFLDVNEFVDELVGLACDSEVSGIAVNLRKNLDRIRSIHVSSCVGSGCKGESFNPTTQGGTPMEANS